MDARRLGVVAVGLATVAAGGWLLLADVRLGESAGRGLRQARPGTKAARNAREAARRKSVRGPMATVQASGYGGDACPATLDTVTTSEFVAGAACSCARSDSNVTGDNPDPA
jgi:hypothetical protein